MSETTRCENCGGGSRDECANFVGCKGHYTATPPTPDLDAVVARVRMVADWYADDEAMVGGHVTAGDLRALLAAVSRPAEARGEPPYMRVKVTHEMVKELAKESAPVTFRIEVENDGDLDLICTRHDCPAPRPETGEVSEAAQALVEKLDVVHAHPLYMGVWMGAVAHGGAYVGPTYEAELNALRAALAAQRVTP